MGGVFNTDYLDINGLAGRLQKGSLLDDVLCFALTGLPIKPANLRPLPYPHPPNLVWVITVLHTVLLKRSCVSQDRTLDTLQCAKQPFCFKFSTRQVKNETLIGTTTAKVLHRIKIQF